ncbi:hypothetical protein F5887DRAFT_891577, partial [Amanita rubescens]
HHAVPCDVWCQRNEKVGQTTLDRVVEKVASPREFKREKVLECITQFIVCDDQSFEVAEKTTFQNVLASMRPQVSKKDIPSAHKVSSYLHNKYSDWMSQLKEDIKVCTNTIRKCS